MFTYHSRAIVNRQTRFQLCACDAGVGYHSVAKCAAGKHMCAAGKHKWIPKYVPGQNPKPEPTPERPMTEPLNYPQE